VKAGNRHRLIVAAFVIVYLLLPTLQVALFLPVIAAALVAFLRVSWLVDVRRALARSCLAASGKRLDAPTDERVWQPASLSRPSGQFPDFTKRIVQKSLDRLRWVK